LASQDDWRHNLSRKRKVNSILKNFVAHPRELRESPAWRALPDNARRVLDRLELEHMRHAGSANGRLPCTYSDFVKAGIRRASVSLAIRQCVALGFLEITRRGGRSISDVRPPSLYRLTHVFGQSDPGPTDEWKNIASEDHAVVALQKAATQRNYETQAVAKPKKAGRANGTPWSPENGTPRKAAAGRANGTPSAVANAELLSTVSGEGTA
jgi:hypothetical protein